LERGDVLQGALESKKLHKNTYTKAVAKGVRGKKHLWWPLLRFKGS
jgi:hypothetical protein